MSEYTPGLLTRLRGANRVTQAQNALAEEHKRHAVELLRLEQDLREALGANAAIMTNPVEQAGCSACRLSGICGCINGGPKVMC